MTEAKDEEGAAYRWALRTTAFVLAGIAVLGAVIGALAVGAAGVWGALAAVAVAALSGLVTQGAMALGYRKEPHVFATYVGGSWLAKIVLIAGGLLSLAQVDAVDRRTFGIVALAGIGATLVIDLLAVRRARISYTGSSSGGGRS